tara:strand:+ start:79 stop:855 length:777 start_codon:yes stop_codon:yes gene_type:complete
MNKITILAAMIGICSIQANAQESQTNKGEIDSTSIVDVTSIIVDVESLEINSTSVGNNISVVVSDASNPLVVDLNQTNSALINSEARLNAPSIQNTGLISVESTSVANNTGIQGATVSPVSQVNTESVTSISELTATEVTGVESLGVSSTAVANNFDGDKIIVDATILQTNGSPVTSISTLNASDSLSNTQVASVASQGIGNSVSLNEVQRVGIQQSNLGDIQSITNIDTSTMDTMGSVSASASAIGNNIRISVGNGN